MRPTEPATRGPDGVIPGDCARLREVAGGEPFTVSLLWSPFDVNIMLCECGCAHERYRPARAQVHKKEVDFIVGTLYTGS